MDADFSEGKNGRGRRVRFVVAYRGTPFHGFARNDGVRTVMGDLTVAISKVVRQPVELTGAGRTDAGVHAWGQVISGDLPAATDLDGLQRRVNKMCAPDISVRSIEWAEPDFDARFSATSRRYRYHVWNDPTPNPLRADVSWHVYRPLDLAAMQAACAPLLGQHDFSSFCRKPKMPAGAQPASLVRILHEANWSRVGSASDGWRDADDRPRNDSRGGGMLRFEIEGSAFCHQMVRSIVGTTVDVGIGRIDHRKMAEILAARDRGAAGTVAPPCGLILWEVGYDGDRWDAVPSTDR